MSPCTGLYHYPRRDYNVPDPIFILVGQIYSSMMLITILKF